MCFVKIFCKLFIVLVMVFLFLLYIWNLVEVLMGGFFVFFLLILVFWLVIWGMYFLFSCLVERREYFWRVLIGVKLFFIFWVNVGNKLLLYRIILILCRFLGWCFKKFKIFFEIIWVEFDGVSFMYFVFIVGKVMEFIFFLLVNWSLYFMFSWRLRICGGFG